ncbi:MAG: hypothetical protein IBX40_06635 [Methanosarcinales archaeon]|nr:hypothetical protein [Methanosarcinales archaeon]
MLESSAGKELGKEALETIREIFKPAKKDDYPDDGDEETFDEYKALPPAPDPGPGKPGKDYTPLKILVRFIENNGDPSAYLETMRVSYPDHPFCQTLITCESAEQLLEKLGTFPFSSYFSDTDFRKNRCKSVLIRV